MWRCREWSISSSWRTPPRHFLRLPQREGKCRSGDAMVHEVAGPDDAIGPALLALSEHFDQVEAPVVSAAATCRPSGALNPFSLAQAIAATLPAQAILVEEAITGWHSTPP